MKFRYYKGEKISNYQRLRCSKGKTNLLMETVLCVKATLCYKASLCVAFVQRGFVLESFQSFSVDDGLIKALIFTWKKKKKKDCFCDIRWISGALPSGTALVSSPHYGSYCSVKLLSIHLSKCFVWGLFMVG